MRCPSINRLIQAFSLSNDEAKLVRALAFVRDDAKKLEVLINKSCPGTAAYARSCANDPFVSDIWRTTMVLHAIDIILKGFGVECFGQKRSGDFAPDYEYINLGDTYTTTLIYSRRNDADNLYIGSWGDTAEHLSGE